MNKSALLEALVRMSANLGRPENDYVILGEGNTSAKIDDESFYVKATGACLANCSSESFVEIRAADVLGMLDGPELEDDEVIRRLSAARVDPSSLRPSIETLFHAYLLTLPGINFLGHTHPTAVNIILCSSAAEELLGGRVCPCEDVYGGTRHLFIPYAQPGLRLARAIQAGVRDFLEKERAVPKVILLQNHGLTVLGATPQEVETVTAMRAKMARILTGAHALGGIYYLPDGGNDRRPAAASQDAEFASKLARSG